MLQLPFGVPGHAISRKHQPSSRLRLERMLCHLLFQIEDLLSAFEAVLKSERDGFERTLVITEHCKPESVCQEKITNAECRPLDCVHELVKMRTLVCSMIMGLQNRFARR